MYAKGTDRLDDERADELTVAGRRFRILRVGRLVRVLAQEKQLLEQGLLTDQDEDKPAELDEDGKRFMQLFHEEEQRRQARYGQRG